MTSTPPFRDVGEAAGTQCPLLVVEGDAVIGEFIRRSLGAMGLHVQLVSSAEGALRELRNLDRVVLVVDDDLPLVRGIDLLGSVRSERRDLECLLMTRDDSVIALVGRLCVERVTCLKKPFQLDELKVAVLRLLEREKSSSRGSSAGLEAETRLERKSEELELRVQALEQRVVAESSRPSAPPVANDSTRPDAEADRVRVLIVDDDPLVRRSMARTFRGHDVTTAENGRAATAEIERAKPDIIFTDLRMPEMDGLELNRCVAARWPDLADRIVFVSGTESHIERARTEAPTQPVLRKPVSTAELEARMAEVLEAATRRPPSR